MRIEICVVSDNQTVFFAFEELRRYLYKIDKTVSVEPFYYDSYTESHKNALWLVAEPDLAPAVADPSMDDAFRISIKNNAGIIAGTNPISVLIGVYSLPKKRPISETILLSREPPRKMWRIFGTGRPISLQAIPC